eukprot:1157350-Pelagomonas_calceolata.AAC.6
MVEWVDGQVDQALRPSSPLLGGHGLITDVCIKLHHADHAPHPWVHNMHRKHASMHHGNATASKLS